MDSVNPKAGFISNHKEAARWLADVTAHSHWETSTAMAMAQYARHGPTQEQIQGAIGVLEVLNGLHSTAQKSKPNPQYNLPKDTTKP